MAGKKTERFKENPFLTNMVITKKKKQVKVTSMGKDDNVLVNQETGEIRGTHVVTYKEVDDAEFVKLFTRNIGLTFDLNAAGIKAFNVLMWGVQYKAIHKDIVGLDELMLDDFLAENEVKLSIATFRRGLTELTKASIIARTMRPGYYFINPNFCFNGDRIAFTTAISKKQKVETGKSEVTEEHKSYLHNQDQEQQELDLQISRGLRPPWAQEDAPIPPKSKN